MMRPGRRRMVAGSAIGLALVMVTGGLAGCASEETSTACPPIAFAFLGALTGPDAAVGDVMRNSAQLAINNHNAALPECEIGLITYDSRGDARIAETLAEQIVGDPQIVAVVGPVFSGESLVAMPVFDAAGLPVVTPSATNPILGEQGWRTFHRVVGTDADQGPAAASWLVEQAGVDTVAVVDDGTVYGKSLADLAVEEFSLRGVTVAPRQQVDPSNKNYTTVVSIIKGIPGVDAVYFGGIGQAGSQLERQLREQAVDGLFVGGDGVFLASFLESALAGPGGGNDILVTCPCVGPASTPAQKSFAEQYRATFAAVPDYFAAEGFDAAGVLLAGIDAGARTRAGLQNWLGSATYQGITKTVRFDGRGEVVGSPIYFFVIDDGVFVPVAKREGGTFARITD
jgi:branched-chain amino acid transport system substrate-binding protein